MERQTELHAQAAEPEKQAYASPELIPLGGLAQLTAAGSGTEAETRGRTCRRFSATQPCA
jgi:hypothetical protein